VLLPLAGDVFAFVSGIFDSLFRCTYLELSLTLVGPKNRIYHDLIAGGRIVVAT
jgi:hypothetical protein